MLGPVGPALFQCHEDQTTIGRGKRNCKFSELNMNKLIGQLIGDPYISLNCTSSECLHYSQLPNYVRPDAASGFSPLIMFLTFGGAVILFLICLITFIRQVRSSESDVVAFDNEEHIPLNPNMDIDDRRRFMMAGHVPCSLAFRDLCYVVDVTKKKKELADEVDQVRSQQGSQLHVLEGIEGIVKSGEVMAIMGGSGAGKTSCLDILAKRQKSGVVSGDILVNGKAINTSEYKSIIGYNINVSHVKFFRYVDQEDTLMDTLTVSETIMYSALLRLPPHMSQESKKYRVYETMQELGILHIANRRIGSSGSRGISGGEKRRVSIACELVTSPSVLFLDEPTSGLDSYNAYNVIECLVSLSRNYQRTVIFTIHQPRSNIYALFDKLLLLAKGKVVYSGPAQETVIDHFSSIGYTCPLGFNIADYLVDLTMHVVNSSDSPENKDDVIEIDDKTNGKLAASKINIKAQQESILFTPRQQTLKKEANKGKENISDSHDAFSLAEGNSHDLLKENNKSKSLSVNNKSMNGSRSNSVNNITEIKDHLEHLIQSFKNSAISKENQSYFLQYEVAPGNLEQQLGSDEDVDEANHNSFKTIKKAFSLSFINGENGNFFNNLHIYGSEKHIDWFTQFKILSDRTFKNLYRNPALLQTQYVLSVIAAIACGTLYYKLSTDIAGFQNRMGAFLFICALLGFGCLSSMPAFASERLIFVKERANSYYKPVTYFSSKVLFDIIPLRVVPPVILGLIIYHMMGLRTESPVYLLKFLFALVLFNLTAASLCFFISIVFKDSGVANLIATLIMLFQMLFGGILLNKKSIPSGLSWLNTVSFYNLAVEALVVNEVNGLALYENKLGLMIDVIEKNLL
ncbi:hypothetical protein HK099_005523 [Clydaea vesicula]|uniref:ABC transporter domain-containing protein n=1 Tax=Clydaea vesicula TaxID=447962 RepID=A0AAD5TZ29_9FUNG|nr:hypothetical protein HK099_005523 [Clydaea vesicula]